MADVSYEVEEISTAQGITFDKTTARDRPFFTPWTLEKSGMPISVNALNKVAEKVIKPSINPSLEPAIMKSSCDFTFLWEYQERKTNIPRYDKPRMSSHFCIYNEF